MPYKYLDLFTHKKLEHVIGETAFHDDRSRQELIDEVKMYLQIIEQDKISILKDNITDERDAETVYRFFRSYERIKFNKRILQYLLTFLEELPLGERNDGDLANPFEQMKTFIRFSVELLQEQDVVDSIIRDHQRLGLFNKATAWYYEGQIKRVFQELMDGIEGARKPELEDYRKLFEALNHLSLYWFSVRDLDNKRIRITDVFIYKLTRLLLEKYFSNPTDH